MLTSTGVISTLLLASPGALRAPPAPAGSMASGAAPRCAGGMLPSPASDGAPPNASSNAAMQKGRCPSKLAELPDMPGRQLGKRSPCESQ